MGRKAKPYRERIEDLNVETRHCRARGAQLVPSEQYPDPAEIRHAWREISEKLSASLAGASSETLAAPVPSQASSLDGRVGGSIALLSLHETFHVG